MLTVCEGGTCTYLQQIQFWEVLQLCRYPLIGRPDAPHGLFGLRTIQVAPIWAESKRLGWRARISWSAPCTMAN